MNEDQRRVHLLATWLRLPLTITYANHTVFPLGPATRDEVVVTSRLILILSGELKYTIEGRHRQLKAGTQFFVPAWVRRVSSVPNRGSCELIWCEFDDPGSDNLKCGFASRKVSPKEMQIEKRSYQRMLRAKMETSEPWRALRMEGELKLMLTRFLPEASLSIDESAPDNPLHPTLKTVLQWLDRHYHEPNALEQCYVQSGMTRNYFRALFTRAMKCAPQAYIQRLRMRRARFLLFDTNWQMKRIAAEVGYDDPLYFSRLYRRFWGAAPSELR